MIIFITRFVPLKPLWKNGGLAPFLAFWLLLWKWKGRAKEEGLGRAGVSFSRL